MKQPGAVGSLRQLVRDTGWEREVADAAPGRVGEWLAEADTLRAGDEAQRVVALRAYAVLHAGTDPAEADGCDRVAWVLDALKAIDPAFEPLLRRAASSARDRIVRLRAATALGAFRVAAGDPAEGEALFLRVLAESRGRGEIPERAACLNLCRLYQQERRTFEALVISRHAVRLFQKVADPTRELFALLEVRSSLYAIDEWEAFDAVTPRLHELIAVLPAEAVTWTPVDVAIGELRALHARGRLDEALARLDELERMPVVWPHLLIHRSWWCKSARAAILSDAGDLDVAARLFSEAAPDIPADHIFRLRHWQLEAVCAARRGDVELAERRTGQLLAQPHGALAKLYGWDGSLRILVGLADALRDHGLESAARQTYDAAAACAVERIREAERAVRALPELASITPEDRELLARARLRFAREHRDLLRSLSHLFESASATGEPWLMALRTGDHTVVCAWCARACLSDGAWVPIGHFLPHHGPLELTHGICADCSEEQLRGVGP